MSTVRPRAGGPAQMAPVMNRHARRAAEAKSRRAAADDDRPVTNSAKIAGPPAMVPFGEYLMVPDYLLRHCHGMQEELLRESAELQPWQPNEFSQRAAAIHEASHCVVTARESYALKSARIFHSPFGGWLGDFWIDWPELTISSNLRSPDFLAHLRLVLAGRRGELLLLGDAFCLRAGLDELTYALMVIMPMLAAQTGGDGARAHALYGPTWETTLAEVDETLLAQRTVVDAIAGQLILNGSLPGHRLAQLVAPVAPRSEPPPIRAEHDLSDVAYDSLAYPAQDPRRSLYLQARNAAAAAK